MPEHYFDNILRWHKQPHYVEIMLEKNALRGLFVEIVESENLQVKSCNLITDGSSRVFIHETLNLLLRKSQFCRNNFIFYTSGTMTLLVDESTSI